MENLKVKTPTKGTPIESCPNLSNQKELTFFDYCLDYQQIMFMMVKGDVIGLKNSTLYQNEKRVFVKWLENYLQYSLSIKLRPIIKEIS